VGSRWIVDYLTRDQSPHQTHPRPLSLSTGTSENKNGWDAEHPTQKVRLSYQLPD